MQISRLNSCPCRYLSRSLDVYQYKCLGSYSGHLDRYVDSYLQIATQLAIWIAMQTTLLNSSLQLSRHLQMPIWINSWIAIQTGTEIAMWTVVLMQLPRQLLKFQIDVYIIRPPGRDSPKTLQKALFGAFRFLLIQVYIYVSKGAQRRPATVPRSTPARLNRIWVESRQCNLSNFSLWTSTRGCAQVWCAPLLNSEAVSKECVHVYCTHRWELCLNMWKQSLGRHILNRI